MQRTDRKENPAFKKAVDSVLSEEEQALFRKNFTSLEKCLQDIKTLEERQEQTRLHQLADSLNGVLTSMEKYLIVGDVMVQYYPPTALVWGGIRLLLMLSRRYSTYFKKVVGFLEDISDGLKFFEDYATKLYPSSEEVQQALIDVYGDILMFCKQAISSFQKKNGRPRKTNAVFKVFFSSFDIKFGPIRQKFDRHCKIVDREIQHADRKERQMQEQKVKAQERKLIAEKLCSHDYAQDCQEAFMLHVKDTGLWFLQHEKYLMWRDGPDKVLWCPGLRAGKTVICSIVIDNLRTHFKREDVAIIFIFCKYSLQSEQTTSVLLRNLLGQLIQHEQPRSTSAQELYKKILATYSVSNDDVWTAFTSELKTYAHMFIVVDALDECNQTSQSKLLTHLLSLTMPVKLMFTARDGIDFIAMQLHGQLCLNIIAHSTDVTNYVKSQIPNMSGIWGIIDMDINYLESVAQDISEQVMGMFLLAKLILQDLEINVINKKTLQVALKSLPSDPQEYYERTFNRIMARSNAQTKLAINTCAWICYACYPLSFKQLQVALSISPEMTCFDPQTISTKQTITSACAGLVIVSENNELVSFAHKTIYEYFERETFFNMDPHGLLASACITYLSFDTVGDICFNGAVAAKNLCHGDVFLSYAVFKWGIHLSKQKTALLPTFLRNPSKREFVAQFLGQVHKPPFGLCQQFQNTGMTITHILSYFGLVQLLQDENPSGMDLNTKDNFGWTPLLWAVENNHACMIAFLLKQPNVDINARDNSGRTPLSWAGYYGDTANVKFLLEHDNVDIHSRDNNGRTVISWAASAWEDEEDLYDEQVLHLLLQKDNSDIEVKDNLGRTPLLWALACGHTGAVRLLLEHSNVDIHSKDNNGRTVISWAASCWTDKRPLELLLQKDDSDIDVKDNQGRTPLSWAAGKGYTENVKLLLGHGNMDIHSKDNDGRTAISWAASIWDDKQVLYDEQVLHLLLQKDNSDIEVKDNLGRTPLLWAAVCGHTGAVRLLLEHSNVDIHSKDNNGRTVISWAASCWTDERPLELLLQKDDSDIDVKDNQGRTPLSWAAGQGCTENVKLLLGHGNMDIHSKDNDGRTAISWAASSWNDEKSLKLLLQKDDSDIDVKDNQGRTPLSWAAGKGCTENVKLLLGHGNMDIHSKDNDGRTAISWAASSWNAKEALELLLKKDDSDINVKDNYGRTPLSWTAGFGCTETVKLLLKHDKVDIHSKDHNGRTVLSWSANSQSVKVMELLLEKNDRDIEVKDNHGRTPLSWAAGCGCTAVVTLLLKYGHVNIYSRDIDSRTPLSWALWKQHRDVVQLLVQHYCMLQLRVTPKS